MAKNIRERKIICAKITDVSSSAIMHWIQKLSFISDKMHIIDDGSRHWSREYTGNREN
jgi:hypothetical protein